MTNDEILLLVDTECPAREYVRIMSNPELIEFARAVAAKEREACAEIADDLSVSNYDDGAFIGKAIRARGE